MAPPSGTVTLLFTDIEGSTKLWEQSPEAMQSALARHDGVIRKAALGKGGHVFKTVGDAFCIAFDTAPDALRSAIEAQLELNKEQWEVPIKVRMAIHTGSVESREGDYFGQPLNRTARLLAIGHGGQILLSDVARDLASDALPAQTNLLSLGDHRLKDLGRPESVYQLQHPELPSGFPALKSLESLPNNLPQQLTSFIGREQAIEDIKSMFDKARLVTLTGSGGSGKTRLSLQVAADLLDGSGDGVWFVDLASLRDASLVTATVAQVFNLAEEGGKSVRQMLLDFLKAKHLLLVLDNCEHLLDACADLADTILRQCPRILILASSREALGIAGETTYRVPSLSSPDPKKAHTVESLGQFEAVRLFIERAEQVQTAFLVTNENAPAVASICARLDGIPLALELAAARVRNMSVQEVNQRLDQRFRLLTGGSRTALPRQQTLRSLIDWSFDLLNDAEKAFLRRLSVFAGGWDLEAAEKVCAIHPIEEFEVLDLLASLADKSLIVAEVLGEKTRYRMLETVRQYARDRLAESTESEEIRGRHLAHFLEMAEGGELGILSDDHRGWLAKLDAEHDNIRAALDWCEEADGGAVSALRIIGALWRFWDSRGEQEEARERAAAVLAHPGAQERTVERARALLAAGNLAWGQGDVAVAEDLDLQALEIFRENGNDIGVGRVLNNLGTIAMLKMELDAAEDYVTQSLAIEGDDVNKFGRTVGYFNLGTIEKLRGNYTQARIHYEFTLKRMQEDSMTGPGIALLLSFLGVALLKTEGKEAARKCWEESLAHCEQASMVTASAFSHFRLAVLLGEEGDFEGAELHLRKMMPFCRKLGLPLLAMGLRGFGIVAWLRGETERAARLYGAADKMRPKSNPLPLDEQPDIERRLKSLRDALGDEAFEKHWAEGTAMSNDEAVAYALDGLTSS